MQWNKIFSRYSKQDGYYTKKVTVICGLKFSRSVLELEAVLKHWEEKQGRVERRANRNLLLYVADCLRSASAADLFCLKNEKVCYIFNNKVLQWGLQNFDDFIVNSFYVFGNLLAFEKIAPQTDFYAEFAERAAQGEFLWKYMRADDVILHTFMEFAQDGGVYINKSATERPNAVKKTGKRFVGQKSRRRFIDGQNVAKYIENKPFAEQKQILTDLLEFIFSKYALPSGKISEKLFDCHLNNFIIDTAGQFHFIDDDLVAEKPLDKQYIIDYMLRYLPELRYAMCQRFGCEYRENLPVDTAQVEWKKLINKYFVFN